MAGTFEAALPRREFAGERFRARDWARDRFRRTRLGQRYHQRRTNLYNSSPAWQRADLYLQRSYTANFYGNTYYGRFQDYTRTMYHSLVDDVFTAYAFFSAAVSGDNQSAGVKAGGRAGTGAPKPAKEKEPVSYEDVLRKIELYANRPYRHMLWAKIFGYVTPLIGMGASLKVAVQNEAPIKSDLFWISNGLEGVVWGLAGGLGLWLLSRAAARALSANRLRGAVAVFLKAEREVQEKVYKSVKDRSHPLNTYYERSRKLRDRRGSIARRYGDIEERLDVRIRRQNAEDLQVEYSGLRTRVLVAALLKGDEGEAAIKEAGKLKEELDRFIAEKGDQLNPQARMTLLAASDKIGLKLAEIEKKTANPVGGAELEAADNAVKEQIALLEAQLAPERLDLEAAEKLLEELDAQKSDPLADHALLEERGAKLLELARRVEAAKKTREREEEIFEVADKDVVPLEPEAPAQAPEPEKAPEDPAVVEKKAKIIALLGKAVKSSVDPNGEPSGFPVGLIITEELEKAEPTLVEEIKTKQNQIKKLKANLNDPDLADIKADMQLGIARTYILLFTAENELVAKAEERGLTIKIDSVFQAKYRESYERIAAGSEIIGLLMEETGRSVEKLTPELLDRFGVSIENMFALCETRAEEEAVLNLALIDNVLEGATELTEVQLGLAYVKTIAAFSAEGSELYNKATAALETLSARLADLTAPPLEEEPPASDLSAEAAQLQQAAVLFEQAGLELAAVAQRVAGVKIRAARGRLEQAVEARQKIEREVDALLDKINKLQTDLAATQDEEAPDTPANILRQELGAAQEKYFSEHKRITQELEKIEARLQELEAGERELKAGPEQVSIASLSAWAEGLAQEQADRQAAKAELEEKRAGLKEELAGLVPSLTAAFEAAQKEYNAIIAEETRKTDNAVRGKRTAIKRRKSKILPAAKRREAAAKGLITKAIKLEGQLISAARAAVDPASQSLDIAAGLLPEEESLKVRTGSAEELVGAISGSVSVADSKLKAAAQELETVAAALFATKRETALGVQSARQKELEALSAAIESQTRLIKKINRDLEAKLKKIEEQREMFAARLERQMREEIEPLAKKLAEKEKGIRAEQRRLSKMKKQTGNAWARSQIRNKIRGLKREASGLRDRIEDIEATFDGQIGTEAEKLAAQGERARGILQQKEAERERLQGLKTQAEGAVEAAGKIVAGIDLELANVRRGIRQSLERFKELVATLQGIDEAETFAGGAAAAVGVAARQPAVKKAVDQATLAAGREAVAPEAAVTPATSADTGEGRKEGAPAITAAPVKPAAEESIKPVAKEPEGGPAEEAKALETDANGSAVLTEVLGKATGQAGSNIGLVEKDDVTPAKEVAAPAKTQAAEEAEEIQQLQALVQEIKKAAEPFPGIAAKITRLATLDQSAETKAQINSLGEKSVKLADVLAGLIKQFDEKFEAVVSIARKLAEDADRFQNLKLKKFKKLIKDAIADTKIFKRSALSSAEDISAREKFTEMADVYVRVAKVLEKQARKLTEMIISPGETAKKPDDVTPAKEVAAPAKTQAAEEAEEIQQLQALVQEIKKAAEPFPGIATEIARLALEQSAEANEQINSLRGQAVQLADLLTGLFKQLEEKFEPVANRTVENTDEQLQSIKEKIRKGISGAIGITMGVGESNPYLFDESTNWEEFITMTHYPTRLAKFLGKRIKEFTEMISSPVETAKKPDEEGSGKA